MHHWGGEVVIAEGLQPNMFQLVKKTDYGHDYLRLSQTTLTLTVSCCFPHV